MEHATSDTIVTINHIVDNTVLDHHGSLRAGELLKLMDACACLSAERHCQTTSVTLSMDDVNFSKVVVHPGNLLVFRSQVNRAFSTSMEIGLRVDVEDLNTGKLQRLCSSYFVFVAILPDGKKLKVPALVPDTDANKIRHELALGRREIRLTRQQLVAEVESPSLKLRYSSANMKKTSTSFIKSSKSLRASTKSLRQSTKSIRSPGKPPGPPSAATGGDPRSDPEPRNSVRRPGNPCSAASQLVLPPHANHMGNTFGGQVMSWCHVEAFIAASRHCKTKVATVSVDDVYFVAPSTVGDRIEIFARVNRVFNRSLEVGVRAEASSIDGTSKLINKAYFTFVALEPNAHVPSVVLNTDDDKRRYQRALGRRRVRLERLAIRGSNSNISWPCNDEDITFLVTANLQSLLRVAAQGMQNEWGLLSDHDHVFVWSKTSMTSGVALKTVTTIPLNAKAVFDIVRMTSERLLWDPVVRKLEVRHSFDSNNDVVWMVAQTEPDPTQSPSSAPAAKDFALLRSWRSDHQADVHVVASHSIEHVSTPKLSKYTRAEVASSGFIVEGLDEDECRLTYVAQFSHSAVSLAIGDLVGRSKLGTDRMLRLKAYCEEKRAEMRESRESQDSVVTTTKKSAKKKKKKTKPSRKTQQAASEEGSCVVS